MLNVTLLWTSGKVKKSCPNHHGKLLKANMPLFPWYTSWHNTSFPVMDAVGTSHRNPGEKSVRKGSWWLSALQILQVFSFTDDSKKQLIALTGYKHAELVYICSLQICWILFKSHVLLNEILMRNVYFYSLIPLLG